MYGTVSSANKQKIHLILEKKARNRFPKVLKYKRLYYTNLFNVAESHLAIKRLVSHSELDKRTGIAGHFLTGLQKKKKQVFTNEKQRRRANLRQYFRS